MTSPSTSPRPAQSSPLPALEPAPPANESSHQREERFRKLLLMSPDANFVYVDDIITLVNPAFCRLLGATEPGELLGRRASEVVHPDFHDLVRRREQQHFANEILPPIEMAYLRLDGSSVPVEVNAIAFDRNGHKAIQVVARDISLRQQAVTALRESEERFKFVARAVSDVVWDWNLQTDTLWWNDGFLTTFGFAAGEIEPSVASWTSRIHIDDRARITASIDTVMNSNAETWAEEYRFQRKDGTHAIVQDRGFILRDATGGALRMVVGMRDLTEQKKMEAQYLRAQRMDSIGTLAGGIAHDLNNVLAPIMMSIELLKLDPGSNPRSGKLLDTILTSCQRGADLVRQVLTFARGGLEGERVGVGLPDLIKDLEAIVTRTFPSNIEIIVKLAPDLWPVTGDRTQLHQILLNLAVNSRDAMPHGGILTLSASNLTIDDQYASTGTEARAGAYVMLSVTDTGVGMRPEVRDRIFEPFFTTKEQGKGTGIGLATVHTIVKSHTGFLTVESEVGCGTTFHVHLPADPSLVVTTSKAPFQAELVRGKGELVLIVDDEFSIRDITQQTLETFGYRVLTARDGAEGVAIYAGQPDAIALVLTDMMMPIMNGESLIHVFKRINPGVRMIAASGLEVPENIAKAARAGVHDFLSKPFTAETLLCRVREVLDRPVASFTPSDTAAPFAPNPAKSPAPPV